MLCLLGEAVTAQTPPVRIGMVADGPWERNEEIRERFRQEIRVLLEGEFEVSFPPERDLQADWTLDGVRRAVEELLGAPDVDLVLAMGVIAGDLVSRRGSLPKPVIAPFVIDAEVQGLSRQNGASGIHNLNYLTSTITLRRELEVFREIADFRHLAILNTQGFSDVIPGLRDRITAILSGLDVEFTLIPVEGEAAETLERIPAAADAVFVYPLLRLGPGELDRLIDGLIERELPSFSSFFSRSDVERGILAGLSGEPIDRRARRVALNVQRILLGEDAGELSVDFAEREELIINMATARAINVYPSFALMTVAELLNRQRRDIDRTLDLREVVDEALVVNRDLAAAKREVAAGAHDIRIARSSLLPRVDVSGVGVFIDEDRAAASFGSQGQRTFSPSLGVTQVLYSEPVTANVAIQREIQSGREEDYERVRLDVAQQAATAYLNVLRTKTLERIQQDNLEVTRSNLELARVRQSIGTSGPAEVLRWESQIASDRAAVIEASARRNVAEITLNQILHRPLEEPFATREVGLEDPQISYVRDELRPYLSNPWYFDIFRDFLAQEGLAASPELQAIGATIAAQERSLLASRRSFFTPEIALSGELSRFFRGGTGSEPVFELPPGVPSFSFPAPGNVNWTLAVRSSFPLFTGGFRRAVRDQDLEALSQLRVEREALSERIELRIRAALHTAGASFAGIRLARDAAGAAQENLSLVVDAYSSGALSILDLLDAQNRALIAEEAAANAVHDFLIDFLGVERAIGRFYFLAAPADREALRERANAYYRQRGAEPPQP